MSSKEDKALMAGMGRSTKRREQVQEAVAESVIGEMVPSGVLEVPVECLYRSRFQVRAMGTPDEIERLAESIQKSDLISPVVVRPVRNPDPNLQCKSGAMVPEGYERLHCKSYEVVAGHHRVLAFLLLGRSMVPVLVKVMTDAEAAIALTSDNAIKKDLTDYDRYLHVLMLKDTGACKSNREVASVMGISAPQVSNLMAFGKLPPEAQKIVRETPDLIGYRAVYGLTSYDGPGVPAGTDLVAMAPEKVIEALGHLASGKIKNQQDVGPWIVAQLRDRPARAAVRRVEIESPGRPKIRISVSGTQATIQAPGIQMDKLQALIEANLELLLS